MVTMFTPNRAVLFSVGAFVLYWILAMFVPAEMLRDVFNALAWGAAMMITITWGSAALKAIREGADTGDWQLVLAIFLVWFVVLMQRIYVAVFNWYGQPEAWRESAIIGFFPYSYFIAAMLFLVAPGVKGDGLETRSIWAIIGAVFIGGLAAGIIIGTSISTV